jgi:hypothetical protein
MKGDNAMHTFRAIFGLEARRFFCRRNGIIFVAFLTLLLLFLLDGIVTYKTEIEDMKLFQETERNKVEHFVHYTQYGAYGIRLKFVPSPMSVLFSNSSVYRDLISNVDSGERLRIYNSFKGRNLFTEKSGNYMDYSGILLLIGAFLALLYGFETFYYRKYQKHLACFIPFKRLFAYVVITRIMLLSLLFLSLSSASLLFLEINGIGVFGIHFLCFAFVTILVMIFFLSIGMVAGTMTKRSMGIILLGIAFFTSIYLIPLTVNKIANLKSNNIKSNYQLELEKLKLLMAFEQNFKEQVGIFNSGEVAPQKVKQLITDTLKKEYKKFGKYENNMRLEMKRYAGAFQSLSVLFPTSFFQSSNNELSSQGYSNFIDFYSFNQKRKNQFIKYYVDKKFYNKLDKVQSFIKGDENLFHANSRLPEKLPLGIFITIAYILGLTWFSYLRLDNLIFPRPRGELDFRNIELDVRSGEDNAIKTDNCIIEQFFNFFSGRTNEFNGVITINSDSVCDNVKLNFVYLPYLLEFPLNLTPNAILSFLKNLQRIPADKIGPAVERIGETNIDKKFSEINHEEIALILLTLFPATTDTLYIFDDFFFSLNRETIKKLQEMQGIIKCEGGKLIYMSSQSYETLPLNADNNILIYRDEEKYLVKNL